MREILFRGKRLGIGEWVYGYYFKAKLYRNDVELCDFIAVPHPETEGQPNDNFLVDEETVVQFTGLTDKNGKKIFEGDLLNGFEYPFYRSESNEHNYFAEVVWFDENCAFGLVTHKHLTSKVRGISAGNADYIEDFNSEEWEVIGNIHDNPELLKEVDK